MAGSDERDGAGDSVPPERAAPSVPPRRSDVPPSAEAAISHAAGRRRAQLLDEEQLDEVATLIAELPEPLAAVAVDVEVARAEGDSTGVRKRLFELGIATVRYAVSLGLALLVERLAGAAAPRALAAKLARAARMSDGQWCALARDVAKALRSHDAAAAELLAFAAGKTLSALVTARNAFVHGSGTGDDSLPLVRALLEQSEPLWRLPLARVASVDPPSAEPRVGVPLRPGVWRKRRQALPHGVDEGGVYLDRGEHWTRVDPWLPTHDTRLLLIDAPHASGTSWRSIDIDSGEHRDAPDLDRTMRAFAGADSAAPVPPSDEPKLVGRTAALTILQQSAERAAVAGHITVVVVTGPQGIGRGRLLQTIGDAAAAFGFAAPIEAVCLQQRRGMLRPLRRAVRGRPGLEAVAEVLAEATRGDALGGADRLEAIIEAVEETLVDASEADPQLLVVDDAQWADESTIELLSMLTERATRKARGRLLVVVAVRDEPGQPAALTRFIGQVERDVGLGATRLALEPLVEAEASSVLEGVAPLAEPLKALLLRDAGGIPFLLVQSVLAWAETGALRWHDGAWQPIDDDLLERPVPGMAELVRARLTSFFEPGSRGERFAEQILLGLALAGGWLPLAQLHAVLRELGSDEHEVEQALQALVDAHLVARQTERHEYGFAQGVVERAVLGDLKKRPYMPRLLGALLRVLARDAVAEDDAAFIADGYLTLNQRDESQHWRMRAIDAAMAQGRFRAALREAERLHALARNDAERAEAALARAKAHWRAGERAAARTALGQLERTLRADPGRRQTRDRGTAGGGAFDARRARPAPRGRCTRAHRRRDGRRAALPGAGAARRVAARRAKPRRRRILRDVGPGSVGGSRLRLGVGAARCRQRCGDRGDDPWRSRRGQRHARCDRRERRTGSLRSAAPRCLGQRRHGAASGGGCRRRPEACGARHRGGP
jgi:hypothetical protein